MITKSWGQTFRQRVDTLYFPLLLLLRHTFRSLVLFLFCETMYHDAIWPVFYLFTRYNSEPQWPTGETSCCWEQHLNCGRKGYLVKKNPINPESHKQVIRYFTSIKQTMSFCKWLNFSLPVLGCHLFWCHNTETRQS